MYFAPVTSQKLLFTNSIDNELNAFNKLREENPEKAKQIFLKGEQLVKCCENGEMRKLRSILDNCEDGEIPPYFTSKMFLQSLLSRYFMISSYLIDNGYPHTSYHVPSPLHECLKVLSDDEGCTVLEFLLSKGADVNRQEKVTWNTPLHIAIRRGLLKTSELLIANGADVNAVAKDDEMPLNIAEKIDDVDMKQILRELLLSKGAKETWRHNTVGVPNPSKTSKLVSFKGGGSNILVQDQINPGDVKKEPKTVTFEQSDVMFSFSSDGGQMFSTS